MTVNDLQTQSQPWTMKQLEPPFDEFRLEGLSAPHGRRRRKPVMQTDFELRQKKTFYAGRRKPTRHHFGDQESDIVLTGRFMDSALGSGGAITKRRELRDFAAAARPIRVRWGSLVSYQGLMTKVQTALEDTANITYAITIEVDADEDLVARRTLPSPPVSPTQMANLVNEELIKMRFPVQTDTGLPNFALLQSAIDFMASVVSDLNLASATFLSAAEAVRDFASASTGQLKRLLGGISQLKTSMITLQNTFDTMQIETMLFVQNAETLVRWDEQRKDSALSTVAIMSLLSDLEVSTRAVISRPGFATIIARDGDTWESLATRVLGGPSGAISLRDANGIRFGEQPQPGRTYMVPQ